LIDNKYLGIKSQKSNIKIPKLKLYPPSNPLFKQKKL